MNARVVWDMASLATQNATRPPSVFARDTISHRKLMFIVELLHNTLCLAPKILHKHCFQFLLGMIIIRREIENNAYAKFWPNKNAERTPGETEIR